MTDYINYYHSPAGLMAIIADNQAIKSAFFVKDKIDYPAIEQNNPVLKQAIRQLEEYFAGERRFFDLSLDPKGTPFQQQVWQALASIPYGETRSYWQIARQINNPRAARAVGRANNTNPITVIVPCHRVIGSNGDLIGYAGGLKTKKQLLKLEKNNS